MENNQIAQPNVVVLMPQEIAAYIEQKEISVHHVQPLLEIFNKAAEWQEKAKGLVVSSSDEVDKMAEARTARLALVKVRTGIEKRRKEINADANAQIKSVNEIAKFLIGLTETTENYLEEQETFAKREEQAKKDKLKADRVEMLSPYVQDLQFYDLENMPEPAFQTMYENAKLAHQQRIENDRKIKEEADAMNRLNARINKLMPHGYKYDNMDNYIHDDGVTFSVSELRNLSDDVFENSLADSIEGIKAAKEQRDNAAKIEAEKLAKENARLQAEKDELERVEKIRKARHEAGVARQQILADIGVTLSFDDCADMLEDTWVDFYSKKKTEYDTEQNRLFVAKKKEEFEKAQKEKQEAEEAAKARALELAPDKEKLSNWLQNCRLQATPDVGADAHKLATLIHDQFSKFTDWASKEIEKLK